VWKYVVRKARSITDAASARIMGESESQGCTGKEPEHILTQKKIPILKTLKSANDRETPLACCVDVESGTEFLLSATSIQASPFLKVA